MDSFLGCPVPPQPVPTSDPSITGHLPRRLAPASFLSPDLQTHCELGHGPLLLHTSFPSLHSVGTEETQNRSTDQPRPMLVSFCDITGSYPASAQTPPVPGSSPLTVTMCFLEMRCSSAVPLLAKKLKLSIKRMVVPQYLWGTRGGYQNPGMLKSLL